jgi:hypothetical protein
VAVSGARNQWQNVEEGLHNLAELWAAAEGRADEQVAKGAAAFLRAFPQEFDADALSFLEVYRQRHLACYDHARATTTRFNLDQLLQALARATKPATALAQLTMSHPWRDAVRKAAAEWTVEVPEQAQRWVDEAQEHEFAARAALDGDEWARRLDNLAAALRRLAGIMSDKHAAWVSTGSVRLARDLFEKRLSLLRPPADDDKILQVTCWQPLAGRWGPAAPLPCWTGEQVGMYNRACGGENVLVSWRDVQRCVLMRQWELLCNAPDGAGH